MIRLAAIIPSWRVNAIIASVPMLIAARPAVCMRTR